MWYLAQRGLQMLVILAVLSAALFGLLSSMPGNPIDLLITSNPNVKPEDVIRLKRLRGLDKPWYVQYFRWLFGYPDPARAPVILSMPLMDGDAKTFDLSDYLVDPNYLPPRELVEIWLTKLAPDWRKSREAVPLSDALDVLDMQQILLTMAKFGSEKQNQFVRLIEQESAKGLSVRGLFGVTADGLKLSSVDVNAPHLWFMVSNSYGQEKIARLSRAVANPDASRDHIRFIDSLIVEDEHREYSVDLKKYLVDKNASVQFKLAEHSKGTLSPDGIFRHTFNESGQSAIYAYVEGEHGKEYFAFDVEHGVVGHATKYNRGFVYFFSGDKNALGFSQTYKRPVYDLLFGPAPICGDGKIDSGETCDDGNRVAADGCSANCYKDANTTVDVIDAYVSGYIVRSGRIGNTVQLMFPALILSLLIAIPLGVFSAYRQYSVLDYIINFLAFLGISLPVFWFGIMMIYVFAESFQWFPAGGVQTPGIYGEGTFAIILDRLKHAILPTMVLSIFFVGRWLRYMRASMLEVLPKDYIRTARAKGLSERVVILKHAFRNALIPVVTVLALSIPSLFGGAVLTETVFSWPGVGRLQYEAVMNSDYYVAIVVFLVSAILVMIGNLFADALYILVDPRIRKS